MALAATCWRGSWKVGPSGVPWVFWRICLKQVLVAFLCTYFYSQIPCSWVKVGFMWESCRISVLCQLKWRGLLSRGILAGTPSNGSPPGSFIHCQSVGYSCSLFVSGGTCFDVGIEGRIPRILGFLASSSSLIGSLSLDIASSHSMWHDARRASVHEKNMTVNFSS